MLGDLSAQYESNGDPGCISDGYGDPGGKSYGTYQFSSNAGSLGNFVVWLTYNYPQYGEQLNAYPLCSDSFDETLPHLILMALLRPSTNTSKRSTMTRPCRRWPIITGTSGTITTCFGMSSGAGLYSMVLAIS